MNIERISKKEAPEKLNAKVDFWSTVIAESGVSPSYQEKFLAILKTAADEFSNDQKHRTLDGFTRDAIVKWIDVLNQKNPNILAQDDFIKRKAQFRENIPEKIRLSDEDQMLLNLFRELREDMWEFAAENLD